MRKQVVPLFLLILMVSSTKPQTQDSGTSEPGFDAQGNIYVSSGAGKRIIMGNTARCWGTYEAPNRQTIACLVRDDPQGENLMPAHKLEIYLQGGVKRAIQPGGLIREWHF